MGLTEKLLRWSKAFDRRRGRAAEIDYDCEAVEVSDLLKEAAERIKGMEQLVDQQRKHAHA
jgi:hypothetical protein